MEKEVAFKDKIKELRKSRGLTQEDLATEMGVSRTLIGYYEIGQTVPDLKNYKKLCIALKVPMNNGLMLRAWQKAKLNRKPQ